MRDDSVFRGSEPVLRKVELALIDEAKLGSLAVIDINCGLS